MKESRVVVGKSNISSMMILSSQMIVAGGLQ